MSKLKNQLREWYRPHDSFVVRSPLLPVNAFFHWKTEPGINAIDSKHILRKSLREFFLQPMIQEALYTASPDMHERLMLWLNDRIDNPDKKEKTELSLIKYMIRMSSRCTPYGLLATCTSGIMGDETNIQFSNKEHLQRFARLDMDFVCEIHSQVLKQKTISRQLRFFPNNSLYRCGDHLRFVEHRFKKETGRSYHLVEIDQSPHLEKLLAAAESGLKPEELAATITDQDISPAEALEFIFELIDSQLLVDELNPSVTGELYFSVLLRRLKTMSHTEEYVLRLDKAAALFKQIVIAGDSGKNALYAQIGPIFSQLEKEIQPKSLIQVDSYRPASLCMLNKKVNDEILKGISLLQLLAGNEVMPDPFENFKTAFRKRYDGEWVPLVEVLDTEWGIGYGKFSTSVMGESPLIDKLPIGNGPADSLLPKSRDTESFKWQLYEEAFTNNKNEVLIDDSQIEQLSKKEMNADRLPDSFGTMVKINAATSKDIDNGNYTISFQSIAGPSGGNLLGRFCHLHPGIEKLTRNILEVEEANHPDCLYAEIVHLPESRTGNILMRPVLRKYEIPYLCNSADKEFEIPVNDLLVGVVADKVTLRSRKLNKQVIPRLTTAHNFNLTTLPVYQFLCDLQNQGLHQVGWQWGVLANRPFLPQVRYDRFILSKARWILAKEEIKGCDNKEDETVLSAFAELKKLRKLPDYVQLTNGDHELILHLQNIYCIRLLLAEMNKAASVTLTEVTDTPDQCWIKSPEGNHAGEFILAFSRKKTVSSRLSAIRNLEKQNKSIKRIFPVGSEWLSARIYCGFNSAEKLLSDTLRPLTKELLSKNLADKFFFLRYYDEGHHIRIRFHNAELKDFWKDVISLLQMALQPFMDNGIVYNLQFETYRREIERYGFDTMLFSEELFWHHSEAVMNLISMLDGDMGEQYRWQVGLKAIDLFLDDFGYTLEQKCKLIKELNKIYSEEFRIGSTERKNISEQFTDHKQRVNIIMSDAWQNDENLAQAIRVFELNAETYRAAIERILNAPSVRSNPAQLDFLMHSYLHMFINRLFVSSQRKTELVIYEYLLKYYESKLAREKMAVQQTIVSTDN